MARELSRLASARVSIRRFLRCLAARRNEVAVEARKRPARDICEWPT